VLDKTQFWLLTIIAALSAVFAVVNMLLFQSNRASQLEVSARQQYIQQSVQLQPLYTEMARAIADLAVRNQDAELAGILKSQGISISGTPNASAPAELNQGPR
jgi:hypothetical protein